MGEADIDVVLRFAASAARRVRETPWHRDATLHDLPDGGVEMRLRVASEVEMRSWVLGWGAAVEVVAPPALRGYVATAMRAGVALYSEA